MQASRHASRQAQIGYKQAGTGTGQQAAKQAEMVARKAWKQARS